MAFREPTHPDPAWWKRCTPTSGLADTDLCDQCGHVRHVHSRGSGCQARSTTMIGNPTPCMCSMRPNVGLYRSASTLDTPNPPR